MADIAQRAFAMLLAAAFLLPLGGLVPTEAGGREVDRFFGDVAEFTVDVVPPGTVVERKLVLPEYCYVVDSRFQVSTHGNGDMRGIGDLRLDVDGDGSYEWAFNSTGAGAFGLQDGTVDGCRTVALRFPSAGAQAFALRLPAGATVVNATMDITGVLEDLAMKPAMVTGVKPFDMLGLAVAGVGDLNRDGFDDVAVGAPGSDTKMMTDNGLFTVYYGSSAMPQPLTGDTISGSETGDFMGFSLSGVRDFNGDGYGEVLVGAPNATYRSMGPATPNTGVAYLFANDGTKLRVLPSRQIPGIDTGSQMGFAVGEVGDIDDDGVLDIAGGEILANKTVVQPYMGRVGILPSSNPTNPVNLWGDQAYSFFGCFITQARDLDSDQKPDFVVGARFNTQLGAVGYASVYQSGKDFKEPTIFMGPQPMANFSASGATGDFNGDGFEDLALGAPDFKVDTKKLGAVFIYPGTPKGPDPGAKPIILQGRAHDCGFGTSVACPGDVDGDGTDDLLVGIPRMSKEMSVAPSGAVDVILTGRNRTVTLWGEMLNSNFGYSVDGAGDVNRDGFLDFLVGAPTHTAGGLDATGMAAVFTTQIIGPAKPRLNVGGVGADDWAWPGVFTRTVTTPDLSNKFNGLLSNPMAATPDAFGNPFVDIPVSVYNDRPGVIVVSNISIVYNWTATVDINPNEETGNLTWALNNLLTHEMSDPPEREIPLLFNSTSAGTVLVHGLSIIIDEAPVAKPGFAVELPEDGSDGYLVDLYTVFDDDFQADEDLTFWIEGYTNDTIVAVDITDWRWLSVDAFNGSASDNWTGEVRIEVSAMDDNWLDAYTNITVKVAPVNDPPEITSAPSITATAGILYSYRMAARDAESDAVTFGLAGGPAGMAVDATGLARWTPSGAQYNRSFDVVLWASDGRLCATQAFSINVSSSLEGVKLTGSPPPTAVVGEEYYFKPGGTTDVPNATVNFTLTAGPSGMTIQPDGTMRWVPAGSQVGPFNVTIAATDGYFTATRTWKLQVLPAGSPFSGIDCAIQSPADGAKVSGKLTVMGSANISQGTVMRVELGVDGRNWKAATGSSSWSCELDTTRLSNGRHTLYARAWDGANYSLNATVTVEVDNPAVSAGGSDLLLPLLLIVVLIAAVAAGAAMYMRRGAAAAQAAPAAAAAPPAPAALPAPPATARTGDELAVEDVFLIHLDGRLIHHATRRLATGVDTDILSSMLTAVTSFVKDALARTGDGQLGSLEYGDSKIILERGKSCYLAVVITGRQEPPELREEMRQALRNVESEYGSALSTWDGNASTLAGVKKFLGPVTAFSVVAPPVDVTRPAEVEVAVAGELEFYQGYVRLKVAVKNSSPSFIMDAALRVIYNDKALRLDRLEPEYPVSGREIMLGNIGIKEKKTVALYLDPQICTESHIEASLTFKDAQGEMHHTDMKRKLASVVCPIMHTDENINIPMLRRMLEGELDQKDSKVFNLPPSLGPEQAFELCKRAVQGHDIRLVREFSDERPFVGEAWYFGKVKGREDRLVVKTAVRAETGSAEFYVASNSRLVVTGLLAELKNDLNKEYRKEKGAESQMETLADEGRRQKVRTAGSLLDKYAQSELAPGSTGPPEQGR